ncbi:MAG: hypothetical protein HY901_34250 [Deltaproteobacteria bacterium]|nr:hypothetical protein [Deltaproteobacteria bacterium]
MKLICVLAAALALAGCSSAARSACEKAKECCSTMSRCEEVNRDGPNWEERCEIDLNSEMQTLGTFDHEACSAVASKYSVLLDCLGGISCSDISQELLHHGHVAKCDPEYQELCLAKRSSGDACGHDWGKLGCDGAEATLWIGHW